MKKQLQEEPELTLVLMVFVLLDLLFYHLRLHIIVISFCWQVYFLSFYDVRLLITQMVSSNLYSNYAKFGMHILE